MKAPRKLHIKSYGCQMNVYDAQRMVDTMANEGFVETATVDDADLVILNTCHIREKASEKVYSELGRLRITKEEAARNGRRMNIAVAGCVAQAEGNEIIRRAPVVDVVVGPQSYHHLPQLLARPSRHGPGIARIRYSTSHPRDVDDTLVAAHRDLPALMPFVHLPVQSGSDRILSAMNRRHTVEDYRRVLDRLRTARQDIAFSSDFIVGFPGETEEDFRATLALVTQIGYAGAYSFKYSPRPGTPAADMRETVSAAEMDQRLVRLQELIDSQQSAFNQAAIGKTVDVLFERTGRNPGQIVGRTAYLQPAHVLASSDIIGQVLPVKIETLERYSLLGQLAPSSSARANTPAYRQAPASPMTTGA